MRDRQNLIQNVLKVLDEVESKSYREAQFPGDELSLKEKLSDDEKRGYALAIAEVRRALLPDPEKIREAAIKLYEFTPGFFPEGAKMQYTEAGSSEVVQDPNGEYNHRAWENCPLFTEHYLYELFGKDVARSILGRLHLLIEEAGVDPHTLRLDIHKLDTVKEQKWAEEQERNRLRKERAAEQKAREQKELAGRLLQTHFPGSTRMGQRKYLPESAAPRGKIPRFDIWRAEGKSEPYMVLVMEDNSPWNLPLYISDEVAKVLSPPYFFMDTSKRMRVLEEVEKLLHSLVEGGQLRWKEGKYSHWVFDHKKTTS